MSHGVRSPARLTFRPHNIVLLACAVAALAIGYWRLAAGDTAVAPTLLVLGYCVLFPLSLAL